MILVISGLSELSTSATVWEVPEQPPSHLGFENYF